MKDKVVHKGSLMLSKLLELCAQQEGVVVVQRQEDGNWKGMGTKNGALITSREQMPEHALTKVIYHE